MSELFLLESTPEGIDVRTFRARIRISPDFNRVIIERCAPEPVEEYTYSSAGEKIVARPPEPKTEPKREPEPKPDTRDSELVEVLKKRPEPENELANAFDPEKKKAGRSGGWRKITEVSREALVAALNAYVEDMRAKNINVTYTALADAGVMWQTDVANMLKGKKTIGRKTLEKWAKVFGVTAEAIIERAKTLEQDAPAPGAPVLIAETARVLVCAKCKKLGSCYHDCALFKVWGRAKTSGCLLPNGDIPGGKRAAFVCGECPRRKHDQCGICRFHQAVRATKKIAAGMTPEEAVEASEREFAAAFEQIQAAHDQRTGDRVSLGSALNGVHEMPVRA